MTINIKLFLFIILILPVKSFSQVVEQDTNVKRAASLLDYIKRSSSPNVLANFQYIVKESVRIGFTIPCIPPVIYWHNTNDKHNRISSAFGWRKHPIKWYCKHHNGIDIAGAKQYVRAAGAGVIEQVSYNNALGWFVIVNHGNSYQSIYGHLDSTFVVENQFIAIGTVIGILGNTGQSTGKHLHYAIKKNGQHINPAPYLVLGLRFLEKENVEKSVLLPRK